MLQCSLVLTDKMSMPASACSVCMYRSAGREHWLRGAPGPFGSRGLFSLIARRERHQRGIEPPWAG